VASSCRVVVAAAGLAVVGVCAGFAPAAGVGKLEIRRIDTGSYPSIRVLVVLPATSQTAPTLTDDGQAVSGLTAENLAGHESVALVVDHSQSMHGRTLVDATHAATAFVNEKPAAEQIAVFAVGAEATSLTGFSTDGSDAADVLQGLSVDEHYGTVLWDAVRLAANSLRHSGLRGRTIIILTDGQNTTSKTTLQGAIKAARAARAAVYTIGIPDSTYQPKPLEQLAAATGGHFYRAPSSAQLPTIYREIGSELRRTWLLVYPTADRPGDKLTVVVRYHDQRAAATTTLSPTLGNPVGNGNGALQVLRGLAIAAAVLTAAVLLIRIPMRRRRWR